MQSAKFICANCLSSYSHKCSLRRHLKITHPPEVQIDSNSFSCHKVFFECAKCHKKFSRKDNLIRHHALCLHHNMQVLFECDHCKRKFNRKCVLQHHLETRYCFRKICRPSIRCIECRSYFGSKKRLNEHYKHDHHVQLLYETIRFECFKEFEEWKDRIERETICHFRVRRRYQNETEEGVQYICHRSGIYKGNSVNRKRLLKLSGSKRIGGHCPAEIMVSCNQINQSCVVTFQNVHVGHEIRSKTELPHMYLSKEEKIKLAAKLNMDTTTAEIIRKHGLLDTNVETAHVNSVDVFNENQQFNTDAQLVFGNDELIAQFFIMQNSESILYFKDKLKDDEKYGLLENADYMIVIMDAVQEESLRRYGHKVVAIDSTHGTNSQGYLLYTLLVVNMDFEGFPVAFALTNRNDDKGISVFFKCIKDRIGVIKTRTLMSDMQLTYFNCWSNIMQPPERHLYCMWHVYDQWKKNLQKISNVRKKKEIKEQLYRLTTEIDIALFEKGFQSFLLNVDDDTSDFIEYFNIHYAACCEKWAYCYRLHAEMNTNMYLERFHNVFKKNVVRGKEIKTVTSCLKYLFEYLKVKEKDYLCKEIGGKISSKLRNLRWRHKIAEKELSNVHQITIEPTSFNTWLVSSFIDGSTAQDMYTVKQREPDTVECGNNCNLMCIQCQVCFHQYKCTCQDSSVHNNMCKHIHTIGIEGVGVQKVDTGKEELEKELGKAEILFKKALQRATNASQVRELIERFIIPMGSALTAKNTYMWE